MRIVSKNNINWSAFKNGKIAINCRTEEDAIDFLNECDKQAIVWSNGCKATDDIFFEYYESRTTYFYSSNKGLMYGPPNGIAGIKVLKWENVDEKIIKDETKNKEAIDHPKHYNMGKYEAIDVIEDWGLGFNLGNTVKYIARAGHKDKSKTLEDLEKSLWYLQREIDRLERGE